jgi:predicted transcriptional regulator
MKSTLLLSIHPRFVNDIFSGVKRVELRRRLPRIIKDDSVVIYATAPTMAVVGYFTVQNIDRLPLRLLWRKVRNIAGISYLEYKSYFDGLAEGVGIFIDDIVQFDRQISLAEMRQVLPDFHPPQGFRYLDNETFELLRSFYSASSYMRRNAA